MAVFENIGDRVQDKNSYAKRSLKSISTHWHFVNWSCGKHEIRQNWGKPLSDISLIGSLLSPESWTDFGDLTVPLLLQHLWTVLSSVGWQLDDKTFPWLLSLHSITSWTDTDNYWMKIRQVCMGMWWETRQNDKLGCAVNSPWRMDLETTIAKSNWTAIVDNMHVWLLGISSQQRWCRKIPLDLGIDSD